VKTPIHVSAPKCHPQEVYQHQRIVKSNTYFRCQSPSLPSRNFS